MIAEIEDLEMRHAVVSIWSDLVRESGWRDVGSYPGLVQHVSCVVRGAVALAHAMSQLEVCVDLDVVRSAALLHDVSKLVEFEPDAANEAGLRRSDLGRQFQHGFYAAFKAEAAGLPRTVTQIIIAHTPFSREVPDSPEGLCVYYADMCAADVARQKRDMPLWVEAHKGLRTP